MNHTLVEPSSGWCLHGAFLSLDQPALAGMLARHRRIVPFLRFRRFTRCGRGVSDGLHDTGGRRIGVRKPVFRKGNDFNGLMYALGDRGTFGLNPIGSSYIAERSSLNVVRNVRSILNCNQCDGQQSSY